jgi:hypothetical protein
MAGQRSTSTLAEGAERLERLIRGVKDRQFSEVHTAPEPKSISNVFAVSPEEEWSRQFMTAGIGPTVFKPVQMPSMPVLSANQPLAPAPKTLDPSIGPARAAAAKPVPAARAPGDVRPGHIGHALAKPARKRSWFGRLVQGD